MGRATVRAYPPNILSTPFRLPACHSHLPPVNCPTKRTSTALLLPCPAPALPCSGSAAPAPPPPAPAPAPNLQPPPLVTPHVLLYFLQLDPLLYSATSTPVFLVQLVQVRPVSRLVQVQDTLNSDSDAHTHSPSTSSTLHPLKSHAPKHSYIRSDTLAFS